MLSNPTLDGGLVAPSITIWLVLAVAVMGGPRRIRLNAKAKAAVTATEARRPRRSMANTYLYRKDRNMCYHIRGTIRQTRPRHRAPPEHPCDGFGNTSGKSGMKPGFHRMVRVRARDGSGNPSRRMSAQCLGPVDLIARRDQPRRRLAEIGCGRHPECAEQEVEVHPDGGRERAGAGDAAGLRHLRLRRRAVEHRPSGLDAVGSVDHVRDDGVGGHLLAGLHGRDDVLGNVDDLAYRRAVGELVCDPAAAWPSIVVRLRVSDDTSADGVDGPCS